MERIWKEHHFKDGDKGLFSVGPLSLKIESHAHDWVLSWKHSSNPLEESLSVELPCQCELDIDDNYERFGGQHRERVLKFSPLLPDLPVVIRPEKTFYVLPKEEVILFVSVPMWLKVSLANSGTLLKEIPSYRPPDTWFGVSPNEGEICYAIRTKARLELSDMPLRPYRAIAAIKVVNKAKDKLFLERIKVPLPNLKLFESESGIYLTETVVIEREKDGTFVDVKTARGFHKDFGSTKKIAEPRIPPTSSLMRKALGSVLSSMDF